MKINPIRGTHDLFGNEDKQSLIKLFLKLNLWQINLVLMN